MSVFPYFLIMQVFFDVDNVFELAGILDCGVASLPLKYIGWGLPIRPCIFGMVLLRR